MSNKSCVFTRKHNDGVTPIGGDVTESWPGYRAVEGDAISANQTDLLVAYAHTQAKLKTFVIFADQNMTVCTNAASGDSPQETIHLVANVPYEWSLSASSIGAAASPFAGDVTALYVTNTTAANLTVRSQSAV